MSPSERVVDNVEWDGTGTFRGGNCTLGPAWPAMPWSATGSGQKGLNGKAPRGSFPSDESDQILGSAFFPSRQAQSR